MYIHGIVTEKAKIGFILPEPQPSTLKEGFEILLEFWHKPTVDYKLAHSLVYSLLLLENC